MELHQAVSNVGLVDGSAEGKLLGYKDGRAFGITLGNTDGLDEG